MKLYIIISIVILIISIFVVYFSNKETYNRDDYIVVGTNEGLCNRLRVLFSYLKYAKSINKKLIYIWEINKACNGYFEELFQNVKDVTILKDNKQNFKFDYYGWDKHPNYNKIYLYDELKLQPKLQKKVDDKINSMKPFISMHIRRTDHSKAVEKKHKLTKDHEFIQFANNYPNHNIYLATDNKETQQKFIELYGNRLYYNVLIEDNDNQRKTTLEDAAIDIFIASEADYFKGSYWSSFSNLIKTFYNKK